MPKDLPIDPRIIEQLAKATIKNLIDGIVELVTNSDDSYRRLADKGLSRNGRISIYVCREKGGICRRLMVEDFAEGMSKEELRKAIIFGAEVSGITEGRSVRGLFGRGLKETIIALGEGQITSRKNGRVTKTRLWLDKGKKRPLYDDEMLDKAEITAEPDGTRVDICVTNEKIKLPEFETFKSQLSNHFALRDINNSVQREVILTFEDLKRQLKTIEPIKFVYPRGELVAEKDINLQGFGDRVKLKILESRQELTPPRNNPYGLAGILIKTRSAILDNQLFKFDNDPAAHYFFGEAICEDLEDRLRKGETELIDLNRGGLEWRHDYCQALAQAIEEVLEPLVIKKKKEIEKKPEKEVGEPTKKMIKKLCSLLNELAKQELLDGPEVPTDPEPDITILTIKPEVANLQKDIQRTFSIYAPCQIIESEGDEAKIKSSIWTINPLSSKVKLEKHPKFPNKIWYRYFKVVGIAEGAEGEIIVSLGKEIATAKVKVGPYVEKRKGKLVARKGGFISDIRPDNQSGPFQRVIYRDGIIYVYVRFPSVAKFLGTGFEGVETPEGRMLLAELVGEAFCRQLARQGLELGKYTKIPGAEIESYNTAMNELQKKYLHKIQEIVFAWKF
ncbi:MAG: ATP-binding protein [Rectinema subterraneum]|uniref:ATP-binding protein n=1 Tax=Rectinema subterraneum TaxID=2653714 RepID=UPI003C7DBE99